MTNDSRLNWVNANAIMKWMLSMEFGEYFLLVTFRVPPASILFRRFFKTEYILWMQNKINYQLWAWLKIWFRIANNWYRYREYHKLDENTVKYVMNMYWKWKTNEYLRTTVFFYYASICERENWTNFSYQKSGSERERKNEIISYGFFVDTGYFCWFTCRETQKLFARREN